MWPLLDVHPGPQQVKEEGEEDLIQEAVQSRRKGSGQVQRPPGYGLPAPCGPRGRCRQLTDHQLAPRKPRGRGCAHTHCRPLVPQLRKEALQRPPALVERQHVLQGQVQRPRRRCAPGPPTRQSSAPARVCNPWAGVGGN